MEFEQFIVVPYYCRVVVMGLIPCGVVVGDEGKNNDDIAAQNIPRPVKMRVKTKNREVYPFSTK